MTLAIYPGSFDPISLGHLDVAIRAARMFDQLVVAIYRGSDKPGALFTHDERVEMAREALKEWPSIVVDSFSGLTVEYARQMGAKTIVRGLRAVSDFEYEFKLAHMNHHLAPELDSRSRGAGRQCRWAGAASRLRGLAREGRGQGGTRTLGRSKTAPAACRGAHLHG
jgi:pantetheine-phosphate adenylyltransferase